MKKATVILLALILLGCDDYDNERITELENRVMNLQQQNIELTERVVTLSKQLNETLTQAVITAQNLSDLQDNVMMMAEIQKSIIERTSQSVEQGTSWATMYKQDQNKQQ